MRARHPRAGVHRWIRRLRRVRRSRCLSSSLVAATLGLGLAATGCADAPADSDAPGGDAAPQDVTAPVVLSSSPLHLQADVYPAPVHGGSAPRVLVSIRFNEPMDPEHQEVSWGPVGGALRAKRGAWSADLQELSFSIDAPAFTGQRPLEDSTPYQIELSQLRDLAGNPAQLAADSSESALRFTSGVYDALLNHACGHVAFGPFASVTAAAEPGPLIPRSDAAHTRFTVTLLPAPGEAATYAGFTRLRAPADATWHLFLDGELPVAVQDLAGQPLPVTHAATAVACAGISHRATFALRELDQVMLAIGPQRAPTARFIVEQVAVEQAR